MFNLTIPLYIAHTMPNLTVVSACNHWVFCSLV